MAMLDANDPKAADQMRQMFGPGQVDEQIRQAIHMCWMMLPPEKKSVGELESQMRRIVDRALKDLREDASQFGIGS